MKWTGAVLLLTIAGVAHGDAPPPLTEGVIDALTSTDSLVSSNDFSLVFNGSDAAVTSLAAIAQDQAADVGVQLRAIRGLSQFPASGSAPHDALVAIIGANTGARAGAKVLILRAAIESIGVLAAAGHAQPSDTALLAPHLNDESLDVRATTARALGQLCDPSAVADLRPRQGDPSVQVQDAITDALRVLTTCPAP